MSNIMGSQVTDSTMIGIKDRTNLLDMPPELRIKIFEYLLAFSDEIHVPTPRRGHIPLVSVTLEPGKHPTVGILQTCKIINIEATPIFYSINRFVLTVPFGRPLRQEPGSPKFYSFRLRYFRWSTLEHFKSISFVSANNMSLLDEPGSSADSDTPPARPSFQCNGKDILDRFSVSDRQYSPDGPDEYMALSLSNWISMKVMRAELNAFQKELEIMMRAVPALATPVNIPYEVIHHVEVLSEFEVRTEMTEFSTILAAHDPNHPLLPNGNNVHRPPSDVDPRIVIR